MIIMITFFWYTLPPLLLLLLLSSSVEISLTAAEKSKMAPEWEEEDEEEEEEEEINHYWKRKEKGGNPPIRKAAILPANPTVPFLPFFLLLLICSIQNVVRGIRTGLNDRLFKYRYRGRWTAGHEATFSVVCWLVFWTSLVDCVMSVKYRLSVAIDTIGDERPAMRRVFLVHLGLFVGWFVIGGRSLWRA